MGESAHVKLAEEGGERFQRKAKVDSNPNMGLKGGSGGAKSSGE